MSKTGGNEGSSGGGGFKKLLAQHGAPGAESGEDVRGAGETQQISIRVDAESVAVLRAYADREDLKTNRLFDEAIRLYAVMLKGGIRVKQGN